ncbi:hypothetical protein FVP01_23190 [Vibrio parahaemolyticus]|uniref:Uncharacterized protein n=1 Tax=Vibrio parahaemolyticus TaxID=670 RepID=A0AA46QSP7_VIBPH|nr:hypothetical protein FVP01_23190 [Vibrio parahaemolyticus]
MAFFTPSLVFVFTVVWFRLGGSVAHYLTRRYMPDLNVEEIIGNIRFFSSSTIVRLFGNDYL